MSTKIRILPTKEQKKKINDWIAAYRKTWNLSVHAVYEEEVKCTNEILRKHFVLEKHMTPENYKKYEWLFRTGKRIREYGVKDFVSTYNTCQARVRKEEIKQFRIGYKNKYDFKQTIPLSHESTYILSDGIVRTNGLEIKLKEIPGILWDSSFVDKITISQGKTQYSIKHNLKLTRMGDEYFISLTGFATPKMKNHSTNRIISIDPGVNTFITYYSPQGEWGEIGSNVNWRLEKLRKKEDSIRNCGRSLQRGLNKIKRKIINLVDDFHWKTVHYLLSKFDKILIPRLYVGRCNKKIKDAQKDLRHCQFVDRLIYKSMFYSGKEIHEVKEHWTSKTCTKCGNLDRNFGSDSVYKCGKCGLVIGRDINAARNILLKHLS